jgi:hypothetical protein
MAITIEQTLLNNQSILERITLVEEIDEQGAEIISGGQSGNLLNKNNEQVPVMPNPVDNPVVINPVTGPGTDPSGNEIPPSFPGQKK